MNEIRTGRLLLRTARAEDLEALHRVFSNAPAMTYWSTLPHADVSQTAELLEGMISVPEDEGVEFVVEFERTVVGKVGFWRFPEIGYIFHPDYWNKGIATEAISALLEYGFKDRNLESVLADVDPRNEGSIRVLEKLGFKETHRKDNTIKVGEAWYDSVYLMLRAQEFRRPAL